MLGPSRASPNGKQRQTDTRDSQSGTLEHGPEGLGRRSRNSRGSTSSTLADNQASTGGPYELPALTEPRGDTDKEFVTATALKSSRSSSRGEGSSRRSSKRAGDRQSSSSSKSARTSSSTSATSLSSSQVYARRESESSISARIRTTEAELSSLRSKRETLRRLADLEKISQQAKDKKKRLWEKNKTQGAKNTAYGLYRTAERNETRHTGAFMRALKEERLSLEELEDQSLNARLDELGKHIRALESQLLKDKKALGRRKNATSDPPEGPVRTGTKSATPNQRSRSPHGSASIEGMVDSGDRTGKTVKHAFLRESESRRILRVTHKVPRGIFTELR